MSGIDDRIDLNTAGKLMRGERPMATCPKDGEPLIMTVRWPGAEFICIVCNGLYGFLSPKPVPPTPELQARYEELKAMFDKRYRRCDRCRTDSLEELVHPVGDGFLCRSCESELESAHDPGLD